VTLLLFAAAVALFAATWNRLYPPVPARIVVLFFVIVAAYQAETLFTAKVDVPANVAGAYPWRSLPLEARDSNTGIVTRQLVPWTEAARRSVAHGELPLWNRGSGAGTPLFANQQTALLHPFTLAGWFLPIGKAFTLSACLRLFAVLFFMFVLLRGWGIADAAAVFGAIAYAFSTFQIVWLLFPIGLTIAMLPAALAAIDLFAARMSFRTFVLLACALAAIVLGGHPESALWAGVLAAAYAAYRLRRLSLLAGAGGAAITAIGLTAVWWMPTAALVRSTARYEQMQMFRDAAPHRFSADWFLPLIAPNVLGTPQTRTYIAPRPHNTGVLDDYGEIASGYAGIATLALAAVAMFRPRRPPLPFLAGAVVVALATIAEVPGWRTVMWNTPLIGLTLWQRLRFVIPLVAAALAAIALDDFLRERVSRRAVAIAMAVAAAVAGGVYVMRGVSPWLVLPALLAILALWLPRKFAVAALAAATLAELVAVTWRYNPPARPEHLFPTTGAIAFLQRNAAGARFVAAGWSFLAETPSYYGIEDVKTTDPITLPRYARLAFGYLDAHDYDRVVRDFSQPFFDFLNIKYIYVPPGDVVSEPRFRTVYGGDDGAVMENTAALPRYFLASSDVRVEPSFGDTVARLKQVRDFRATTFVDTIPPGVAPTGVGRVVVRRYSANGAELDVDGSGWNLIATSEPDWPGWRASYNGRPVSLVRVNGAFIGTFVPPGRGVVRFQYRPRAFTAGAAISGCTALLLVWAAAGRSRRKKSRKCSDLQEGLRKA
jgi:hypothetical protein